MVSDAMYHGQAEDTEDLQEEGRPRPMAGFRVALVSSTKRKAEDGPEEEPPVSGMRRTVSAPPVLRLGCLPGCTASSNMTGARLSSL